MLYYYIDRNNTYAFRLNFQEVVKMKISTKVECGIMALIDIAVNSRRGDVVKVTAISKRNKISAKYLEQILPLLKHSNIVNSVKGASGGYILSRRASEIRLSDIMNALDSTILKPSEFSDKLDASAKTTIEQCVWTPVTDYLQEFLEKVTLEDLADHYNNISSSGSELMYYI